MKVIDELVGYFERQGKLTPQQIEQLLAKGFLASDAPHTLLEYREQIGQSYCFRLTGQDQGHVWGTEVYTTDSTLAKAAVHAGALRVGETGVVRVHIVEPEPEYLGSTRNGVTSQDYGSYPGAYRVERV